MTLWNGCWWPPTKGWKGHELNHLAYVHSKINDRTFRKELLCYLPPPKKITCPGKKGPFQKEMNDLPTIINLWFSEVMVVFKGQGRVYLGVLGDYNPLINTPTLEAVHPCLSPDGWGAPFVGRFHLQVSLGEIPASNLAHNRKHEFHQPPILVVFWCFLEGKWDPGYFRKDLG